MLSKVADYIFNESGYREIQFWDAEEEYSAAIVAVQRWKTHRALDRAISRARTVLSMAPSEQRRNALADLLAVNPRTLRMPDRSDIIPKCGPGL